MEKGTVGLIILSLIFIISLSLFIFSSGKVTGYATTASTTSNVSIAKFLSIDMSANLSDGIAFPDVSALPVTDINATENNNAVGSNSTMFLNVSLDSNVAVDFCILANAGLTTSAADLLGIGNETYLNVTGINASTSLPGPPGSSALLTASYVRASGPTGKGNSTYYRFWLDVPVATPSGVYNNTISFKGIETATSC